VIRTEVIERIERVPKLLRFPRAALATLRFRKETGTTLADLVREGRAMRRNQDLTWSQLALAAHAPMLIKASMVDGKPDVGILPTGQVAGVIDELPTVAELLDRITAEAEATLKRLGDR
jgi:NAD(P)H-dependent flavin oxidoreductase YrpB (nitropropane dioxygenase family)